MVYDYNYDLCHNNRILQIFINTRQCCFENNCKTLQQVTLSMAVSDFVVCILLLVGLIESSQACGPESRELGISQNGDAQLCLNLKCPELLPRTCKDVKAAINRTVVTLSNGFEVLCDTTTDGGGWTVIQRRRNNDVDFYRNWMDYKYGFGNINGNFWLGNEKIYQLTFLRRYKLRVDFTFKDANYFAVYSSFRILGEAEKYRLQVEGYSGNAGDSLTYHNGMAFTTKDRDNDPRSNLNCAIQYLGGWWYNLCHMSNLNGRWGSKTYGEGPNWYNTTSHTDIATYTEMKIKPID